MVPDRFPELEPEAQRVADFVDEVLGSVGAPPLRENPDVRVAGGWMYPDYVANSVDVDLAPRGRRTVSVRLSISYGGLDVHVDRISEALSVDISDFADFRQGVADELRALLTRPVQIEERGRHIVYIRTLEPDGGVNRTWARYHGLLGLLGPLGLVPWAKRVVRTFEPIYPPPTTQ